MDRGYIETNMGQYTRLVILYYFYYHLYNIELINGKLTMADIRRGSGNFEANVNLQTSGSANASSPCRCQYGVDGIAVVCYDTPSFPRVQCEPGANVTKLSVVGGNLSGLHAADFAAYPHLRDIYLEGSNVSGVDNATLAGLTHFRSLNLSWNVMTEEDMAQLFCSVPRGTKGVHLRVAGRTLNQVGPPLSTRSIQCIVERDVTHLDFASNKEYVETLTAVFCAIKRAGNVTSLNITEITVIDPEAMDAGFFGCLEGSSVDTLGLADTDVSRVGSAGLSRLSHLHYLDLAGAQVQQTVMPLQEVFANFSRLHTLRLSRNGFKSLASFTKVNATLFPALRVLNLRGNDLLDLPPFRNGTYPRLEELHLDENLSPVHLIPAGFVRRLGALRLLRITRTTIRSVHPAAFTSDTLEVLLLYRATVDPAQLHPGLFRAAPSLRMLDIGSLNPVWSPSMYPGSPYFRHLNAFLASAFRNLTKLETINLRNVRMDHVYSRMFSGVTGMRNLLLSANNIRALEKGAIRNMTKLEQLYLDHNKLSVIRDGDLPPVNHTLVLHLQSNSWECDCALYWFRQLIAGGGDGGEGKYQFWGNETNSYVCSTPDSMHGTRVSDYSPSYSECFSSHLSAIYCAVLGVAAAAALIVLVASSLFRFRWHIEWCYINTAIWRRRRYAPLDDEQEYAYNAFVCYHREDTRWVVHTLRTTLEEEYGLRLCLHDRDWTPGVDIVENIVESLRASRKVVLVVTNAFARSNWCQLELAMAQHQMFAEDRGNVILVVKERVLDAYMTPRLALQMRTRNYVEWDGSAMGRKVFWARLSRVIAGPTTSVRNATVPSTTHP